MYRDLKSLPDKDGRLNAVLSVIRSTQEMATSGVYEGVEEGYPLDPIKRSSVTRARATAGQDPCFLSLPINESLLLGRGQRTSLLTDSCNEMNTTDDLVEFSRMSRAGPMVLVELRTDMRGNFFIDLSHL